MLMPSHSLDEISLSMDFSPFMQCVEKESLQISNLLCIRNALNGIYSPNKMEREFYNFEMTNRAAFREYLDKNSIYAQMYRNTPKSQSIQKSQLSPL